MSVRKHMDLIVNPLAKFLGAAGRQMKRILGLQTSQADGWWHQKRRDKYDSNMLRGAESFVLSVTTLHASNRPSVHLRPTKSPFISLIPSLFEGSG
jgi:hypothetical protein